MTPPPCVDCRLLILGLHLILLHRCTQVGSVRRANPGAPNLLSMYVARIMTAGGMVASNQVTAATAAAATTRKSEGTTSLALLLNEEPEPGRISDPGMTLFRGC